MDRLTNRRTELPTISWALQMNSPTELQALPDHCELCQRRRVRRGDIYSSRYIFPILVVLLLLSLALWALLGLSPTHFFTAASMHVRAHERQTTLAKCIFALLISLSSSKASIRRWCRHRHCHRHCYIVIVCYILYTAFSQSPCSILITITRWHRRFGLVRGNPD